jgi:hypothetical protein
MKNKILFIILALSLFLIACETSQETEKPILLPVNMSITLVQGNQTNKIIADFHYLPDDKKLDHITWSNHQTHYFEYNESGRLKVVRVMRVDVKIQEERWFVYDGSLVERIDLVKRNLDYKTLEPLDSIYTGYVELKYEGEDIIEESEYVITEGGFREEYIRDVTYEYDSRGNLLSSTEVDPRKRETLSRTMTYDQSKHPFYALQYYFTGESFVNNMLTKSEENDFDYTYNLQLNEDEYPEIIYEELGSTYTRIINYSYRYL